MKAQHLAECWAIFWRSSMSTTVRHDAEAATGPDAEYLRKIASTRNWRS